jgi:two-component system KDP operon response regulator KdpE
MTVASRAVLIIEDEPQIRRVLRTLMELEQFRVIEADTAALGISAARTYKPDLMIVDLGLPDRNGMQVIAEVRAWSRVPIITSASHSARASWARACRWRCAIARARVLPEHP